MLYINIELFSIKSDNLVWVVGNQTGSGFTYLSTASTWREGLLPMINIVTYYYLTCYYLLLLFCYYTVTVITLLLHIITPFFITYYYNFHFYVSLHPQWFLLLTYNYIFCYYTVMTLLLRTVTSSLLPIITTSLLHIIITLLLHHYYIIITSLFPIAKTSNDELIIAYYALSLPVFSLLHCHYMAFAKTRKRWKLALK